MDLAQLKKEHPELVVALSAEIMAGLNQEQLQKDNQELVAAMLAQGAQNERDRIADVRAQSLPGHEGLIAQLELDGTSTGADAAKAIVAAENELRKQASGRLEQQSNQVVPPGGDPASGEGKQQIKREAFNKLPDHERRAQLADGIQIID